MNLTNETNGNMADLTIEIEETLLRDVQNLCSELGFTIEQLIVEFLRFCACPENYDVVRELLCGGKTGNT